MNEISLQALIEEGRFDEVDDRWFEEMAAGQIHVDDFLQVARLLGRNKEKERAGLLLGLLAEHYLEKEDWTSRFRVLSEISRHTADPKKIEDLKDQIEQCLKHIYPDSPSFQQILNHFHYHEIKTPEEIKPILEKIQPWLSHDVGQLFYEQGRGVGKVREININLGLVRLDFEGRKDGAVDVADSELLPLPSGHILREKIEAPDSLRERALQNPDQVLAQLLQQMNREMTAGEIKDCFAGIIPENQWSKWWNNAKKNPQMLVSGKGAQATYSWTESTSIADEAIRKAFVEGDLKSKIELAKHHSSRSNELKSLFEQLLLKEATKAMETKHWATALEILESFAKGPLHLNPGFSMEDVLRAADSMTLLSEIDNAQLKLKVLEEYRRIDPDRSIEILHQALLKEENPRVLGYAFETLQNSAPQLLESSLEQIFRLPHAHASVFSWICQRGEQERDSITARLEGKFLIALLNVLDDPEFSTHRNKIKKALENGLLMNILANNIDPDQARKAIELMDHSTSIEDYRRDRWMGVIRMRFPEFKQREEWIFSTKEAIERKRGELEHLIKIELPKNRTAVGEAAAMGDLSENHEYKAARERQEYLINRVQQLQNDLARVRLLEPGQTETSEVRPGTRVTLAQNGNKVIVTILGPWDSNPKENVYSYQSQIGINLIGKAAGEQVQYNDAMWQIEKIEPWS